MKVVVTGAAGMIGSNLVHGLNAIGIDDVIAVDDLTDGPKYRNLLGAQLSDYFDKREFYARFARGEFGHVDAVFDELGLDQRKRQRRAVDRTVDERHHVRHAADVILVAVRQHEGGDAPFLLQVGEVRDDPVHAEQLGVRKHHPRIHHHRRLAPGEREHVHPELAESAERYDIEHVLRGLWVRPSADTLRAESIRSMGAAVAARSGCWVRLVKRAGCQSG